MVAALSGLKPEYESARHQILTSSTSPTMKDTFRRLLNMTGTNVANTSTTPPPSAFVTGTRRGPNSKQPYCEHCRKLGHTEDKCWKKHGRPTASINVFQSSSASETTLGSQVVHMSSTEYEAYRKYQNAQHVSPSATSQSQNPFACVTSGQSLGPWIVDSGATDHMSGSENGTDDWQRA